MPEKPDRDVIICSVDIETTGPVPGLTSMISVAAVPYTADGERLDVEPFNHNLIELPGWPRDTDTMVNFWEKWPAQWQAARWKPSEPDWVMDQFNRWAKALPGRPVFMAWPVGFDWGFVNWYFHRYVGSNPFGYSPLCLKSYGAGLLRDTKAMLTTREESVWPKDWISLPETPHVALNDALEQGEVFSRMRKWAIANKVADDLGDTLGLYLASVERSHALAADVITAALAADPLAMLDVAADFLNNVDAVMPGDAARYEAAKAALQAAAR